MTKRTITRIAALLRLETHGLGRRLLRWGLAVFALAMAAAWIGAARLGVGGVHTLIFDALLCVSGLVVSAGSFACFSDKARRIEYLALPAHPWEKLASKFILLVPLYLLVLFGGYFLIAILIDSLFAAFGLVAIDRFEPFASDALVLVPIFLALQGLWVLGAIVFNQHALARILAAMAAVLVAGALLAYAGLRVGYADHFDGWRLVQKIRFDTSTNWWLGALLPSLLHAAFFYLLPVSGWIAAGIALKKKAV